MIGSSLVFFELCDCFLFWLAPARLPNQLGAVSSITSTDASRLSSANVLIITALYHFLFSSTAIDILCTAALCTKYQT